MSIEENKKIVTQFWDAFSNSDFDRAISMMADQGFTWWIAGDPQKFPIAGLKTKDEFVSLLKEVLKLTPGGIRINPLAMTAEGDRVAVEAESFATTVTGKVYNNKYHFLMEVRGGRLQSVKEYLCTIHANEVLCT